MTDYLALMGCEKKGTRFEVGDTVPGNFFSTKIVKHWLKKGVLAEIVDDPEPEEDVDGDG